MSIVVQLPSWMRCDEPGCKEEVPVQLCLLGAGGFAFRPTRKVEGDWQIGAPAGGAGPFQTRCPSHHKKIERPPLIQGVNNG